MKKINLLLLSTLFASNIYGLTLEEALTSGYNENEDLKINRSNFLAEIEQFPSALAEFMPRISASSSFSSVNINRKSSLPLAGGIDNISSDTDRTTHAINLEQPIFNGWSSVQKLKAAQAAFNSSRSQYYSKEQETLLDIIDKYLSCVVAKEKYSIAQQSLKANHTQLKAMKEKFRQGESTATEVASARAGYATAEANVAITLAQYEASKASFSRVVGLPAQGLEMPKLPEDVINDLDKLLTESSRRNLSIENARSRIITAKASNAALKGQLLPQVGLNVRAEKNSYTREDNSNGSVNNKRVTTSLGVTIPILAKGGAEYAEIRSSHKKYRISLAELDSTLKKINAACIASLAEFDSAKKRVDATKEAVKASELSYDGMVQEEMLGSKTIIDVLVAETRLNEARQSLIDAKKALLIAAYSIKSLTGDLTAQALNLPVNYFIPEQHFKKTKYKIVGFK